MVFLSSAKSSNLPMESTETESYNREREKFWVGEREIQRQREAIERGRSSSPLFRAIKKGIYVHAYLRSMSGRNWATKIVFSLFKVPQI